MQQLRELISQQANSISIVEIHDNSCSLCPARIELIQVICQRVRECNQAEDEMEPSTIIHRREDACIPSSEKCII